MSTNPVVEAIRSGSAPKMAKLAAARGVLPLAPEETLEVLVTLHADGDDEIRSAADATLGTYNSAKLRPIVDNPEAPAELLGFLAQWTSLPRDLYQPVILHQSVPDDALEALAARSDSSEVIELISLKQQSLIRTPTIIDAILANPRRTPEAERRAREVRSEFFEKEFGAQIVADEQRAQAGPAVEEPPVEEVVYYDDLMQFIETDLVDTEDALLAQFEEQYGTIDEMVGVVENLLRDAPEEVRDAASEGGEVLDGALDLDAIFASDTFPADLKEMAPERVSLLSRIVRMSVKERIRFAIKGTREVRMILIRDPNRPVATAVIYNPRITENEIEQISNLKGVHDEVLRVIGNNRSWTKNYNVIHNLVRNPKTPIPTSLSLLNRIQTRDLRAIGQNKGVPEVIRTMANRHYQKRQAG